MNISDKAVEAAAKHLAFYTDRPGTDWTVEALALLEATAPHMLAVAWGDAMQYAYEEGYFTRPQMEALQESNPYRSQAYDQ